MPKFALSYFYQIRFFKQNMLPLSTAVWDPKWFHAFNDMNYMFFDKRGVLNGARCTPFVPGESCDGLCHGRETCQTGDPTSCAFLSEYRKQLDKINVPLFLAAMSEVARELLPNIPEDDVTIVFIVYEKPDNPCSERWVLLKWFEDHHINCKELEYPIT